MNKVINFAFLVGMVTLAGCSCNKKITTDTKETTTQNIVDNDEPTKGGKEDYSLGV